MARSERYLEYRIQHALEDEGFLVINPARSKPFDLVAIKRGVVYLIEVKGRNTRYPREQYERQVELANRAGCNMAVIRKTKERGKVLFSMPVLCDSFLPLLEALRRHFGVEVVMQ